MCVVAFMACVALLPSFPDMSYNPFQLELAAVRRINGHKYIPYQTDKKSPHTYEHAQINLVLPLLIADRVGKQLAWLCIFT